MKIDRLLSITVTLLNRSRVSAKELAEKFSVNIRTIYRDIDSINAAGIPVISYPGANGGFGILDSFKLSRQVLTLNDMSSILGALKSVNTAIKNVEYESAIEKIQNLIPNEKKPIIAKRAEQFAIDLSPWGTNNKVKGLINELNSAIHNYKLCELVYSSYRESKVTRLIESMTLIFKGYNWYLFAWCRLRKDFRIFKLSRINSITIRETLFDRRDACYKDYMKDNWPTENLTEITLRFNPKIRAQIEDYFNETDIVEDETGFLIVNARYPKEDWIYSMLLSYQENCEILDPPEIREEFKNKLKIISELY